MQPPHQPDPTEAVQEDPSTPYAFDKHGRVAHWWGALCAIPPNRETAAYRRLRRVWLDRTRFHGPAALNVDRPKTAARYHEISKPDDETHLTATLWENFSIFDCAKWVPKVYAAAGLPESAKTVRCHWAYEWADKAAGDRMVDVVAEHEDDVGKRHVFVIEAKALSKKLGDKDLDITYYLEKMAAIAAFAERRSLIYLVDEARRDVVNSQIGGKPCNVGVLTWQQLGGL